MPLGVESLSDFCHEQASPDLGPFPGTTTLAVGVLVLAVALCVRHLMLVRRTRRGIEESHRKQWARSEGALGGHVEVLVQSLLGVVMQVHAATARLPAGDAVRECLEQTLEDADRMLANERRAVVHPSELPSRDDLCAALTDAASCLQGPGPGPGPGVARVRIVAVGRRRAVNAKALFAAYRIAREAIANALRHAQASTVTVAVVYGSSELSVRVKDDGAGFFMLHGDAARRHGLARMQALAQRLAGSLSVLSVLGGGTAVEFRLGAGQAYEV